MTNDTGPVITARLCSASAAALLRATKNTPSSVIKGSVPRGERLQGSLSLGWQRGQPGMCCRVFTLPHPSGASRAPQRVGDARGKVALGQHPCLGVSVTAEPGCPRGVPQVSSSVPAHGIPSAEGALPGQGPAWTPTSSLCCPAVMPAPPGSCPVPSSLSPAVCDCACARCAHVQPDVQVLRARCTGRS